MANTVAIISSCSLSESSSHLYPLIGRPHENTRLLRGVVHSIGLRCMFEDSEASCSQPAVLPGLRPNCEASREHPHLCRGKFPNHSHIKYLYLIAIVISTIYYCRTRISIFLEHEQLGLFSHRITGASALSASRNRRQHVVWIQRQRHPRPDTAFLERG